MKGKGKSAQQQMLPEKDCPLQFPDLTIVNHEEECKRYTAVLARSPSDSVVMEEMDPLQTDLEVLLASVGRRLKLLESEIQILQSWQDKKDVKTPLMKGKGQAEPPSGSAKRGKVAAASPDDRPTKKFKDSSGKVAPPPVSVASPVARAKTKMSQMKSLEGDAAHSPAELPRVVKNECVDRFWQAMEAYSRPINEDDLKYLEDQLRKLEDEETTYFKVPALGRHYREVWAQEDLIEEMTDGSKVNDKKRNHSIHTNSTGTANGTNGTADAAALLKKAENSLEDSPYGPLTQRIVSALLEENLMTKPMDDIITEFGETVEEASAVSPRLLAKQLNIGNPAALERRIQRELEDQGILEPEEEEEVEEDPNDEILSELKQAQSSLKPLLQWKLGHLRDLLKKARDQMARQQLWKKFEESDAKLHDEYRKLNVARQKKKPNLKKERESVKKVLKDWWAVYQTLDDSYDQ